MGLLAVAIALWFASPVAALPAAAEIRFPIPGLFTKEKPAERKRYGRPTLPRRNPTRVTARLSVSAISPPQARDSTVAAAAGAKSWGTVLLALPRAPERPDKTAEASAAASPSSDTDPAETKTEQPDAANPAENEAAATAEESVVLAVEMAAEEPTAEVAAAAGPAGDAIDETDTDKTATTVSGDEPKVTAATEPSRDSSEEDEESSAENETATADTDPKATETEPNDSASGQIADTKSSTAVEQSSDTPAPAEMAQADEPDGKATTAPTTTAALPDHDASVVLDVTPPPEDLPAKDELVEDNATETDVATPSAPVKDEKPGDEDSSPMASDADSDAASDSNTEQQVPDDTDASGEAEELAEEPAPPPAHPIVALVRGKLENPSLPQTVASSDLKALKEFYGVYEGPPLWVSDGGFTAKAQELIAEIGKADEWGLKASSFDTPSTNDRPATPDAIADDELQLSVALLSYARDAQIGQLSPRSVSKLFDQHPSLRDPKIVLKEIAEADKPSAYLLLLHPQHEQFERLRKALAKARENAELTGRDPRADRDVQLITINMERWRWLPRHLGNYHVWSNVPEFNVRVKKNGRTIYQEKTIVGQYKYATPFFSAKMRNIVFHPNWTVPPTIVKEDIAPKLQGRGGGGFFNNSKEAILRRYGLKASLKGEPINADTVDWSNVNIHTYTFTQDPGPANVLGKFKFNFPNRHAIYMHDTVQRELFAQTNRTLSHGCIRVNQPDRFATLLLSQDKGWTAGQVQDLVASNESKVVSLNRHVPVHLTYFTAVVDEYGNLNRFGDIYGIDNIMAAKLFNNPASFGAPASASLFELGDAPTRSRRRSGGGLDNFISGLFGN